MVRDAYRGRDKREQIRKEKGVVMEWCYETRTNGSDTVCHDAEGAICNFTLGERGGPGRVPRAGTDGEGRTASVMKSYMRY
jgi:hypothetical protein